MHPRNRNFGNGYRSHPMGMGGLSTAPPDRFMRGQGGYHSEYRGFNNGGGYGRGQPRQFQRPPQPKHGDVLMEAGRLATEYLVSKGVMPPNVLSGNWSKDSFRNHVGGANVSTQFNSEGRASALSRLGADGGPGRKRYQDDCDLPISNDARNRRRSVSFKNSSPERNREFGRSVSMSVRSRAGDKYENPSCQDEQKVGNKGDTVSLNPSSESVPENDRRGTVESTAQKHDLLNDKGAKESSSSSEKDLSMLGDTEVLEKADVQDPHPEAGEIKDESSNKLPEQQGTKDAAEVKEADKSDNVSCESNYDLIKFCNFVKVPTRTRSSVASRGSKSDMEIIAIDVDAVQSELQPPKESGSSVEDMAVDGLLGNNATILQSDSLDAPSKEDGLEAAPNNSLNNTSGSISEVDTSSSKELVIDEKLPDCEIIDSNQQGEKRASDHELSKEENKQPRESAASENVKSEECLHRSDSLERQLCVKDPTALADVAVIIPSDEKMLLDNTLFPKGDIESCMDYVEEKQLFPSSFKTCDLNLMEASDVNENRKNNSMLLFPPANKRRKPSRPVDIDLSMSNNPFVSKSFGECSIRGKDIEVIDLEDDTEQEDMHLKKSNDRGENIFTCLDGYSNNTHSSTDISEVQDGYGLMVSEFLANGIHSTSAPTDLNSLHVDLGLHNGEGILGDDDAVYMSLGEIPMSGFLKDWEQSNQDYDKPF